MQRRGPALHLCVSGPGQPALRGYVAVALHQQGQKKRWKKVKIVRRSGFQISVQVNRTRMTLIGRIGAGLLGFYPR